MHGWSGRLGLILGIVAVCLSGSALGVALSRGGTSLAAASPSTTTTTAPVRVTAFVCAGGPAAETCNVPARSYVIELVTNHVTDFVVRQEPSGQGLFAAALRGGVTHSIQVTGASSLVAYAGGSSVKILIGGRTVGVIAVLYDYKYTFQPATGTAA
jgi:hypothetical protein